MILNLLALAEQLITYAAPYWEYVKQELRTWLGPVPIRYFLIPDGRVLPSIMIMPEDTNANTYVYDPFTKQITKVQAISDEGRYKQLPIIGIVIKHASGTIDISDWVGELRAKPVPDFITAKQLVILWSYVHNTFVPFTESSLSIVKNDGTEETIVL